MDTDKQKVERVVPNALTMPAAIGLRTSRSTRATRFLTFVIPLTSVSSACHAVVRQLPDEGGWSSAA